MCFRLSTNPFAVLTTLITLCDLCRAQAPDTPTVTDPLCVTVNASVTLTATTSGTQPISFQWYKEGAPLADATNETFSIQRIEARDYGYYSVAASNEFGRAASKGVLMFPCWGWFDYEVGSALSPTMVQ
jgi:hypothetical protein